MTTTTVAEAEAATTSPTPARARPAREDRADVVRIVPVGGWALPNFDELWKFRGLLYFLAWRDVKVRYKQTFLGAAWAIIQPVLLMIVFVSFLGRIARVPAGNIPYPLFVYLGVLPWTFFATAISSSAMSVVGSERLVTKIYFPRLAIPIAAAGAAVLDFVIGLGLLVVMMFYYGVAPGVNVLLLPVIYASIVLTALGVGLALSALNVLYRDFRYVIPFMVQVWMFATPTIYMVPGDERGFARVLSLANPMTGLVAAFRGACVGEPVSAGHLALYALTGVVVFTAGSFFFRRLEMRFADVI